MFFFLKKTISNYTLLLSVRNYKYVVLKLVFLYSSTKVKVKVKFIKIQMCQGLPRNRAMVESDPRLKEVFKKSPMLAYRCTGWGST